MKKKMNLGDLKVKSFVTSMGEEKSETAKGGTSGNITNLCTMTDDPMSMNYLNCGTHSMFDFHCPSPTAPTF